MDGGIIHSTIFVILFVVWTGIAWHQNKVKEITKERAKERLESVKSELNEAIQKTEIMMNESLESFSCIPMVKRKILFNDTQDYEMDVLMENEPYVITYNDKRVYRKDVSDETYQQLIKLDQAFTAFEKVREDYPLTMEELQENLGEEEE